MNRRRWIYVGLMVLAGGAFIVDRVFLGGPQAAEAEVVTPHEKAPAPTAARAAVPEKNSEIYDPSLHYLDSIPDSPVQRDVFSPGGGMLQKIQAAISGSSKADQGPKPGSPDDFREKHKLQATYVSGGLGLAVVDGEVVRIGEKVDQYRLLKVDAYSAEFRRGKDRVVLEIPVPQTRAKAGKAEAAEDDEEDAEGASDIDTTQLLRKLLQAR